jgi:DNA polymerase-4
MTRTILHSDLNGFYASVEIMLDPALRGRPSPCALDGGAPRIVLDKSEPANKAASRRGWPNWEAIQGLPGCSHTAIRLRQYVKYSDSRGIYTQRSRQGRAVRHGQCWLDLTVCGGCEKGRRRA